MDPFTVEPLDGFLESAREVLGVGAVLRRFLVVRYPEERERWTVHPGFAVLFAEFTTKHGEGGRAELCRTEHPGYQTRFMAWAEERAAAAGVRVEEEGVD